MIQFRNKLTAHLMVAFLFLWMERKGCKRSMNPNLFS